MEVQNQVNVLTRTSPEAFKKMDEIETNIRQQLLPSITGKDNKTDKNLIFSALPVIMGGLDLLINIDFPVFMNYQDPFVIH